MSGWRTSAAAAIALTLAGCGGGDGPAERSAPAPAPTTTTVAPPSTPPVPPPPSTAVTAAPPVTVPVTEIPLRLERLVDDDATSGFADVVVATLTDPRGWTRAGFAFTFRDDAPNTVVLAEGPDVDALCAPYDTAGRFSCQLGPVVALNADRWRTATPEWTGDLDAYRQMLVNHEVGHLLGQHHPAGGCTTPGEPSPVMVQQSTNLDGCLPNPWPLDWEVACAAARLEPLAPPHEDAAEPLCGPSGPVRGG